MINIGAVDTHIDPYTHTNEYSSEPPVAVCYSCCFTIYYKHPRWDLLHPRGSTTCPLCKLPHYQFCSLFSFLCSGIRVIKSQCVWPDDDGYRNTERAQEYLSIVGGANPNLELSHFLSYFSVNPQAAVIATQLRMMFNKPQSSWSKYEGTRYSHGLRNYANINFLCY